MPSYGTEMFEGNHLFIDANSIHVYAFIWIVRVLNHAFDTAYVCIQVWLLKKCLNILNVL